MANPELDPELNFKPRTLGYHDNNHGNDGLFADLDPLLLPASINPVRLSPWDVDTTRYLAGSRGHSPACNDRYNASLDIPTTNMAAIVQRDAVDKTHVHDQSSVDNAQSSSGGALEQVLSAGLPSSRRRFTRRPVTLELAVDCTCKSCHPMYRDLGWNIRIDKGVPANYAHSSIELCDNPECDSRYGIRRVPDTEHLFNAQICHGRDVSSRCAAPACNFVCVRWSDLRRHHVTKHCIKPKLYPCPEPLCGFGGEHGFKRLDKLKDHHRKVHEGKLRPVQVQRPIQSAATKPAMM